MNEELSKPVFTEEFLYHYCHPTTAKEAGWYEFLRHCHCHRCPEWEDCDVQDFLSCEVPKYKQFKKCSCFLCIGKKRLRKIIESSGYYKDRPKPKKRRYEEPDYYEEALLETTI